MSRGRRSAARGNTWLLSLAGVAAGMDGGGSPSGWYLLMHAVLVYSYVTEMTEMAGDTYTLMMLRLYV